MTFDKKKVKHIIFDMDGTLLDTMPGLMKAYCDINHKKFGLAHDKSREHFLETTGNQIKYQLEDIIKKHNILQEINDIFFEDYRMELRKKLLNEDTTTFLDVVPVLKELEKKYTLSVSTGAGESFALKRLEIANILKHFALVLGHAENNAYTKGPQHVDEFCKRLHVSREELEHVIYVGDAKKDVDLAKDAGMFSVARIGTFSAENLKEFGADLVIHDLSELVAWLSE